MTDRPDSADLRPAAVSLVVAGVKSNTERTRLRRARLKAKLVRLVKFAPTQAVMDVLKGAGFLKEEDGDAPEALQRAYDAWFDAVFGQAQSDPDQVRLFISRPRSRVEDVLEDEGYLKAWDCDTSAGLQEAFDRWVADNFDQGHEE